MIDNNLIFSGVWDVNKLTSHDEIDFLWLSLSHPRSLFLFWLPISLRKKPKIHFDVEKSWSSWGRLFFWRRGSSKIHQSRWEAAHCSLLRKVVDKGHYLHLFIILLYERILRSKHWKPGEKTRRMCDSHELCFVYVLPLFMRLFVCCVWLFFCLSVAFDRLISFFDCIDIAKKWSWVLLWQSIQRVSNYNSIKCK